jgi:type I restriction enzyme, S subunit
MSILPYENYKDSGIDWLAQVPRHWEVKAIKWISPVLRGASPRPIDDPTYFDEDGEFAWVRIADVSSSNGILNRTSQKLSQLGSSLSVKLNPGSLFVSIAGTVGKPCITTIKACIHDGFVYFPRMTIEPKFLYRIFEAGTCYGGLGKWGTQLNLNTDTIGSIRVAVPPKSEIEAILTFLDYETGKIDALVREQRRLIELLKEKRRAIISHAVTKGLNPSAPMKDSGIPWLGEVPEHWNVKRIKRVTRSLEQGWSPQCEGFPVDSLEEWGVLKVGCVNGGTFNPAENKKLPPDLKPIPELGIAADDLLVSRANTRELVGGAAVALMSHPNLLLCDKLYRLRLEAGICSPHFLAQYLSTPKVRGQIELSATGASSSMLNIGQATIREMPVALPPIDEQFAIVASIESATNRLEALISQAAQAIVLLQERRTALVSAAVTGKIDVQGLAVPRAEAA